MLDTGSQVTVMTESGLHNVKGVRKPCKVWV
jgi:hypothetical protein